MMSRLHLLAAVCAACAAGECLAEGPVEGRFVRVQIPKNKATLSLCEVFVSAGGRNVAQSGIARQSSTAFGAEASRANDGNTDTSWKGGSITHTMEDQPNPWWEVDLRGNYKIDRILVYNREELPARLNGAQVMILSKDRVVKWEKTLEKPSATLNDLIVNKDDNHSSMLGKKISGNIAPVSIDEVRRAYTKKGSWIETLLATQAKLDAFKDLLPVMDQLFADFPADTGDIILEYNPQIYGKQSGSLAELAQSYVNALPGDQRKAWSKAASEVKTLDDLAKIRTAYRESHNTWRQMTYLKFFNADALERAIHAYAAKYPDTYKDKDELLKRLAALKPVAKAAKDGKDESAKLAAAKEIESLEDAVYLKHPAIDFKDLIFVRRSRASCSEGFPNNWQGNSSVPLHGYLNDIVRAPLKQTPGAKVQTLFASGSILADVDLHYDADRIAYSGGDDGIAGWRIFETSLDKPLQRKRLTPEGIEDIDCYDPCYLPDGRMLFVATSGFHGVPCVAGSDYVGNTHILNADGSIRRLVFDQDNSWCPVVMNNGRVLYLRWEYTDSAHYFSRVLMTMNPDGSDQQEFYGSNSYWPNSLFFARPLPGSVTKICGIVSGHHGLARQGELVLFDAAKGRQETDGVIQRIPGYGQKVENRTRDMLVNDSRPLFLHPFPLSDELFLVAMHENPHEEFFIALCDIYDNFIPLWQESAANLVEPLPLRKTAKPALPVDRYRADTKECTVYLANIKIGKGISDVPAGKVKKLRLFSYNYSPRNTGGHYHIGFEGPWDGRLMLGTVNVEPDGSCMFKAPANIPIAVQPLGEDGSTFQLMRSWFVGVPGETISCMGCHERQNAAPASGASMASKKKPQTIQPWYGPARNFSFEREVQPVLDQACIGCHNSKTTKKNKLGQPLPNFENTPLYGYSTAYVNLMAYVRRNGPEGDYHLLTPLEFSIQTSELFQKLIKGHHNVKLTPEQWDRLVTWTDINLPYWGSFTERDGNQKNIMKAIERRKEMAKKWANVDIDPEIIVNPYKPSAFTPPAKGAAKPPLAKVDGFPFDAAKAQAMQGAKPAETIDLGDGQKLTFSRIPAGAFVMGSNDETPAERPTCAVKIEKPFWMAQTEISQAQMKQFDPSFDNGVYDQHYKDQVRRGYYMGYDPEFPQPGKENFPAIRVSWEMANAYCQWLSKKIGKKVLLPTEAQWEWACRAGTATPMNYGGYDTDFSKHENLADYTLIEFAVTGVDPKPIARGDDPHPARLPAPLWDYELRDRRFNDHVFHLAQVGSYEPNAWGLKDMHGNVAEWTRTAYKPYPYSETDGRNDATIDELKVVRGGSWHRRQMLATSAWRWRYPGWMRPFDVGFRVIIEE